VHLNASLQWLLVDMPNKSILVIEHIDCCCDAAVCREDDKAPLRAVDGGGDDEIGTGIASDSDAPLPPAQAKSKSKSKNNQVKYSCLNHKVVQC
jgi:chaperone BCS1